MATLDQLRSMTLSQLNQLFLITDIDDENYDTIVDLRIELQGLPYTIEEMEKQIGYEQGLRDYLSSTLQLNSPLPLVRVSSTGFGRDPWKDKFIEVDLPDIQAVLIDIHDLKLIRITITYDIMDPETQDFGKYRWFYLNITVDQVQMLSDGANYIDCMQSARNKISDPCILRCIDVLIAHPRLLGF